MQRWRKSKNERINKKEYLERRRKKKKVRIGMKGKRKKRMMEG